MLRQACAKTDWSTMVFGSRSRAVSVVLTLHVIKEHLRRQRPLPLGRIARLDGGYRRR